MCAFEPLSGISGRPYLETTSQDLLRLIQTSVVIDGRSKQYFKLMCHGRFLFRSVGSRFATRQYKGCEAY